MARLISGSDVLKTGGSRTITASDTVVVTDYLVRCNESGALTATLPTITTSIIGHQFVIKKVGTAADVTVARGGSDLIDGLSSFTLTLQNQSVTVFASALAVWDVL
jgi:hypothetical protein